MTRCILGVVSNVLLHTKCAGRVPQSHQRVVELCLPDIVASRMLKNTNHADDSWYIIGQSARDAILHNDHIW
jgi:hypothetical protein